MAGLDQDGILKWSAGDQVMLMCTCIGQVDQNTVRVGISTPDGGNLHMNVPADLTLYAGPALTVEGEN